jgi:Ca2+-binding RTX toxin-like protein
MNSTSGKEQQMKRSHIFFVALVAAAGIGVFGAGNALAGSLSFNNATGEMTYNGDVNASTVDTVKVYSPDKVWTVIENTTDSIQWGALGCYQYTANGVACPASHVAVFTHGGDDTIAVDPGVTLPTRLEGGKGDDFIQGGSGPDEIYGACQLADTDYPCRGYSDTVYGGAGDDVVYGGDESPVFGLADDTLHGGPGNDQLDGGAGHDDVHGDEGDDVVGGGNDTVYDNLYGGAGTDIADYSTHMNTVVVRLDGVANDGAPGEKDFVQSDIEGVKGGVGNDFLYGNGSSNTLDGGPGDDSLEGGGDTDILYGQEGSDLLRGGYGSDVMFGGAGTDTASWSERTNPVNASIDDVQNDGEPGEGDYVDTGVENLTGGSGNDTLTGDYHSNRLMGGPGNDTLAGKGGTDELDGGNGNDLLDGGPFASPGDTLDGGPGTDTVTYATRIDSITIRLDGVGGEDHINTVENVKAGGGNDTIVGNADSNWIFSNGGDDVVHGGGGFDVLHGGNGNDHLWGEDGHDVVAGDAGADTLSGGNADDYISGHAGVDTVTYSDYNVPVTVSLDGAYNDGKAGEGDNVLPDVETVIGGSGGDTLTGDADPNTLVGGDGPDTLSGLGGADLLQGGPKADVLDGGDDSDTLDGGTENDQLSGGHGYDALRGGPGSDKLTGGADGDTADYSDSKSPVTVDLKAETAAGNGSDTLTSVENVSGSNYADTLKGNDGSNTISGFDGPDTIVGRGGNDHLFGAGGADLLRGDAGDDELSGGPGTDTVDYSTAPSKVTVNLVPYGGGSTGGAGNDWFTTVENATGSAYDDSLTGSPDANVLLGIGGNDSLFGLGGNDKLDGGGGTDSLDGGTDTDSCLNGETLTGCE